MSLNFLANLGLSRWYKTFVWLTGFAFLMLFCVFIALRLKTTKELARLQEISGNSFIASTALPTVISQAVSYAKSMTWKPYDPLMGRFGDPFSKVGFVVCIDVPVRAYQSAGINMPALLREAAQEHREWFSIGPDNPPSSSFFYRRVRNYFPLFRNHLRLTMDSKPHVGDWAFYGKNHIALVINVEADGQFKVIEATPFKGRVAVSDEDYMAKTWGSPVFFGRIKAGKGKYASP